MRQPLFDAFTIARTAWAAGCRRVRVPVEYLDDSTVLRLQLMLRGTWVGGSVEVEVVA